MDIPMNPAAPPAVAVRAGRVGAWYDLIATVGFVTPWTAGAIFELLRAVHAAWGLPGEPVPAFAAPHMMFVNLFGAGVTMWALARIVHPVPWMIALDTAGRLVFSVVFLGALAQGASGVLVPFLVLELAFLLAQGLGVLAALRRTGPAPAGAGTVRRHAHR